MLICLFNFYYRRSSADCRIIKRWTRIIQANEKCRRHSIRCAVHFQQKAKKRIGANVYLWEAIHAFQKRYKLQLFSFSFFFSVYFTGFSIWLKLFENSLCNFEVKLNFFEMFMSFMFNNRSLNYLPFFFFFCGWYCVVRVFVW